MVSLQEQEYLRHIASGEQIRSLFSQVIASLNKNERVCGVSSGD